ncbi:uncharacterized protein UDID_19539 [Ustilago sp. UG-2017a]|nr:uncharacterized protein UDID_19539 [Ustilago sp. UG-2017a]
MSYRMDMVSMHTKSSLNLLANCCCDHMRFSFNAGRSESFDISVYTVFIFGSTDPCKDCCWDVKVECTFRHYFLTLDTWIANSTSTTPDANGEQPVPTCDKS